MDDFRSVPEEVQNLLREIEATKDTLKGVSVRLASIEKHIRRAFQVPKPAKKSAGSSRRESTLTREQLLVRFDEIRSRVARDTSGDDNTALDNWSENDVRALARELGASNTKNLSLARIREFVMQKVRESVMLGTNSLRGIQHGARDQTETRSHVDADS